MTIPAVWGPPGHTHACVRTQTHTHRRSQSQTIWSTEGGHLSPLFAFFPVWNSLKHFIQISWKSSLILLSFISFVLLTGMWQLKVLIHRSTCEQQTPSNNKSHSGDSFSHSKKKKDNETHLCQVYWFIFIFREKSFLNRFTRSIILAGIIFVDMSLLKLDYTKKNKQTDKTWQDRKMFLWQKCSLEELKHGLLNIVIDYQGSKEHTVCTTA